MSLTKRTLTPTTPTDQPQHLYKVLVIGDVSVGKTSIIKRLVNNTFSENYKSTVCD